MKPEIFGYWEGYIEHNVVPYKLKHVPDYIKYIPIAFIAPKNTPEGTVWTPGIAGQQYTVEQIRKWCKQIHNRGTGQKVLFSLMSTPSTQWDEINMEQFAKSIAETIHDWDGLHGVDVDCEAGIPSSVYASTMIKLVKTLRKELGPDAIINYTTYLEDNQQDTVVSAIADDINHVVTMAYWDDLDDAEDLFNYYAQLVGDQNKIAVGVACTQTSLNTIQQIGNWLNSIGCNKMMLWSLTQDVKAITGEDNGTWGKAIYSALEKNSLCSIRSNK